MKINLYKIGIFTILALPILTIPPYFFPSDFGKTLVFRSIMAILIFIFLWNILNKKIKINWQDFKNNKIIWALVALFGIYFLASIFSVDSYFSFWGSPYRGGGFVNFAFYFVFAFLIFLISEKKDWKKYFDFSILIGVLVSFVGIIQYFGWFNKIFIISGRPSSAMGNPDLLALYILLLFFTTLTFTINEQKKSLKAFYLFSLIIFSFTILVTGSRAAYLGILFGAIYFLFFYPNKEHKKLIKILKIVGLGILFLAVVAVFYINFYGKIPQFLEKNKLFNSLQPRLSIQSALKDGRLSAWSEISVKAVFNKPVLGYGPENFSVGFDKYYNPSTPILSGQSSWWDKGHNILIQTASDAGILAVIIYLALFFILFYYASHKIRATLIAYFIAIFFGFDSFSTYLIFFLLIAYTLHLTFSENVIARSETVKQFKNWQKIALGGSFIILVIFLWQYNFIPLSINAKINNAENLAEKKQCDKALYLMDNVLSQHSFLDSYARMQYVQMTKICNNFYPENNLSYIKKDFELLKEAVKIQPNYTRYWIFLGETATTLAQQEQNSDTKNDLLKQSENYFKKAMSLAPKHQEIFSGLSKMEIVAGNYKKTQDYVKECIGLNPNFANCYFYLALSKIYLKDYSEIDSDLKMANKNGRNIDSEENLNELANAYISVPDYKNLAKIYEKLISITRDVAQYHSTLAFIYKNLGEYKKAREEALIVLKISPESKENVEEFLRTLPY